MKIIASDYDGTLNHNGINDEKRESIERWQEKGNLFGIVSGRGIKSLLDVVSDKNLKYDFLIANNGAIIFDNNLNLLFEARCDGRIAKGFIKDLFSWGCPFASIDNDEPIMVSANVDIKSEDEYLLETMPENLTYFNQISTMLTYPEEASEVITKINGKYSDVLTPLQNGRCIDIVPLGVNKAKGIYALLEVLGARYKDVITVGDNVNDTHMIAEFRSYAMENAADSIKELADGITSDITELIEKEL